MTPPVIQRWIDTVEKHDGTGITGLLAADAVFHSPAVFTPQEGRELTAKYLSAAAELFGGNDFRYVGQWHGIHVDGIDMTVIPKMAELLSR